MVDYVSEGVREYDFTKMKVKTQYGTVFPLEVRNGKLGSIGRVYGWVAQAEDVQEAYDKFLDGLIYRG